MHNPDTSQAIVSYFWCSQTFSIFTQYISVSHGYNTIGGIGIPPSFEGGCVWYVSNVSIIFYCSMLYYLLFWTLLGFIIHFYFFGTNLLTGGPAQNCYFLPISEFRGKRISNGVETERNQLEKLFLEGKLPDGLGPHVRSPGRCLRGWGRVYPLGAPLPSWPPLSFPRVYSKSCVLISFQK